MTDPLRIVVLAALTVFVVSSFSTGSAVAQQHEQRTRHAEITCENSKDCPVGDRCKRPHHKKTGICVGASSSAKKKYH
jgi:hypothetical protein